MADLTTLHKKAQKAIEAALEPSEEVLVALPGESGAIVATNRRILVTKWGALTGSMFGTQMNSWELSHVTGVEYRTGMTTAAIVIQTAGAQVVTKFGRLDKGPGSVWESPNAVFVSKKPNPETSVQELRRIVADHQGAGAVPLVAAPAQTPDPTDQVRKLAALRDEGLLTEDEFQTKKRDILGL